MRLNGRREKMGTNFFLVDGYTDAGFEYDNPKTHIGKRSAAGIWCWDCGVTLYMGGVSELNGSRDAGWYDKCPECGKYKEVPEPLEISSAGRELGFNKNKPIKKTGVKSCSSFNWAMCPSILEKLSTKGKPIIDEYGNRYSLKDFYAVLSECPVRRYESIGNWFS
jgi:hypothetical protein